MPETLLDPSNILLYGRVVEDLQLTLPNNGAENAPASCCPSGAEDPVPAPPSPAPGDEGLGNNNFLRNQLRRDDAQLARIYGFSYEGHYYDLARPAIFVVHGDGLDPEAFRPSTTLPDSRVSRAPADADRTGVAYTASSFSHDIRVWAYDQGDFSLRLDTEAGTFEQILLDAELRSDASYSGAKARGADVRGANVQGANVRGANVRGANVRGANVRGNSD